jgi:hypothetical protein
MTGNTPSIGTYSGHAWQRVTVTTNGARSELNFATRSTDTGKPDSPKLQGHRFV